MTWICRYCGAFSHDDAISSGDGVCQKHPAGVGNHHFKAQNGVGLATEEMTPCPSCEDLTFEIGPCFRCCATKPKDIAQIECEIDARNRFWYHVNIEEKAAAFDAIMAAENAKPWGATELTGMMQFANGFVRGWVLGGSDEDNLSFWVTFADDIEIHFFAPDERDRNGIVGIEVFGYRNGPYLSTDGEHNGRHDEVRLI